MIEVRQEKAERKRRREAGGKLQKPRTAGIEESMLKDDNEFLSEQDPDEVGCLDPEEMCFPCGSPF